MRKYKVYIVTLLALSSLVVWLSRPISKPTLSEQQAREETAMRIVKAIDKIENENQYEWGVETKKAILREHFDAVYANVEKEYNIVYDSSREPANE